MGFFAGALNYFGWLFDLASIVYIMSELVVQMYALYHDDYIIQPWNVFVGLVCITWICIAVTIFFNRFLPYMQQFGLFIVLVGGIVTIITLAAMPKKHASTRFVWVDFENGTGWSGGVAFLTGVLNGAFTIGTPDAVTHMAEELPHPKRDLPKAIFAQIGLGFLCTFHAPLWSGAIALTSRSSCVVLRDRALLRRQRLDRRPDQQRFLPLGGGLFAGNGQPCCHFWPAVYYFLIPDTLPHWYLLDGKLVVDLESLPAGHRHLALTCVRSVVLGGLFHATTQHLSRASFQMSMNA